MEVRIHDPTIAENTVFSDHNLLGAAKTSAVYYAVTSNYDLRFLCICRQRHGMHGPVYDNVISNGAFARAAYPYFVDDCESASYYYSLTVSRKNQFHESTTKAHIQIIPAPARIPYCKKDLFAKGPLAAVRHVIRSRVSY
jgi:hypothetical protein